VILIILGNPLTHPPQLIVTHPYLAPAKTGTTSVSEYDIQLLLTSTAKAANDLLPKLKLHSAQTDKPNAPDPGSCETGWVMDHLSSQLDFFVTIWEILNKNTISVNSLPEPQLRYPMEELDGWRNSESEPLGLSLRVTDKVREFLSSQKKIQQLSATLVNRSPVMDKLIHKASSLASSLGDNDYNPRAVPPPIVKMVHKKTTTIKNGFRINSQRLTSQRRIPLARAPSTHMFPAKVHLPSKLWYSSVKNDEKRTKSKPASSSAAPSTLGPTMVSVPFPVTPIAPPVTAVVAPPANETTAITPPGQETPEPLTYSSLQKGKKKPRYQTIDDIPQDSIYFKCLCRPELCSKVTLVWPNKNKDDARVNGAIAFMKQSGIHLSQIDHLGRQMIIPTVPRTADNTGISYANGFVRHKQHVFSCCKQRLDLKVSDKLKQDQIPEIFRDYRYCGLGLSEQERRKIERENKKKDYAELKRNAEELAQKKKCYMELEQWALHVYSVSEKDANSGKFTIQEPIEIPSKFLEQLKPKAK